MTLLGKWEKERGALIVERQIQEAEEHTKMSINAFSVTNNKNTEAHVKTCYLDLCPQEAYNPGGEKKYSRGAIFALKKNKRINLLLCKKSQ